MLTAPSAVLAIALAGAVLADGEPAPRFLTPRAEAARQAVLEWCEVRGGEFSLGGAHDLAPRCWVVSDPDRAVQTLFLGMWEIQVPLDVTWWWQIRATYTPEFRVGVLWLVDATKPAYDRGRLDLTLDAECNLAGTALLTPAKVPVRLVGPSADECSDLEERGRVGHELRVAIEAGELEGWE